MFTIHCPQHDSVVLLGPRSIRALVPTPHGVEVHWRCHCGATGVQAPDAGAIAAHPAGRNGRVAA